MERWATTTASKLSVSSASLQRPTLWQLQSRTLASGDNNCCSSGHSESGEGKSMNVRGEGADAVDKEISVGMKTGIERSAI